MGRIDELEKTVNRLQTGRNYGPLKPLSCKLALILLVILCALMINLTHFTTEKIAALMIVFPPISGQIFPLTLVTIGSLVCLRL